jgi:hypothetical protein
MDKKLLIIAGIILIILAIAFIINATPIEEKHYLVEMKYEDGTFTIINKTILDGKISFINENNYDYKFNVVSANGEAVFETSFDPTLLFSDGLEGGQLVGGIVVLNKTNFYLELPLADSGEKLEISKEGTKIFESNLNENEATPCRVQ